MAWTWSTICPPVSDNPGDARIVAEIRAQRMNCEPRRRHRMSIPDRQRAIVMNGPGAPLETVDRPVDEPGPGQALVRVRASSLNFHDNVNLAGLLPGPWPRVPMTDGAGEVVAVGGGVDGLRPGDRVMGAFHPGWQDGLPSPEAKREVPGDNC